MELLIPGLILVGFMVWASTRIKRKAARAFERETVETPEFSVTKPEGFLAPVDPADGTLFSAYSKEFGEGDAGHTRRATAEIRRFGDTSFDEICERVKIDSVQIASDALQVIDQRKCRVIEVERIDKGVTLNTFYKIIVDEQAIYQLTVSVLPGYKDEHRPRIDEFLDSFEVT